MRVGIGREGGREDNKYIQVALLYIIDTNGTEESVIVSEVSSFQRLSKSGTRGGKRCPV